MKIPEKLAKEISQELEELSKKDPNFAGKTEDRILELMKTRPEEVIRKGKQIVKEVYEIIRIEKDIDKVNKKKISTEFLKQNSRIGRISYKKALDNMVWHIKKYFRQLNWRELETCIQDIDTKHTPPEDYDCLQTAKIRDEFVFLKDGKLNFHLIEKGKEIIRKISLKENSIIILGKNKIFRIDLEDSQIDSDTPNALGIKPLDSIYFIKGQLVFVWRR